MILAAVIMAAGNSRRMGENKLLMELGGKSIINAFMDHFPVQLFGKTIVVFSDDLVGRLLSGKKDITLVQVEKKQDKSVTIKAGIEECAGFDGVMFFTADQPFLTASTVLKLIEEFENDNERIVVPFCEGRNRNPVIFPKSTFKELSEVVGDRGGRDIIDRHKNKMRKVEIKGELQFMDIDTREDYERAKKIFG